MIREKERLTILADELRNGNERVFTDIYELTQQDLYVYALMLMKDPDKAQDLMQDTYIKIYESAHTLRDPSRFMPWSKRILYTQAMMEYRRQGKAPITVDEDKEGIFENIEEESMEYIPEAKLDRAELQRIVFDVVKKLPPEQRVTMVAYYYDEMSVKEIAEMMGCSEGTVKSRLFNGRKAFKSRIETYEEKHGIRLHSAAPLLFAGFAGFDKASAASAGAVQKTLVAVAAKTGMKVAGGAGGTTMYGAGSAGGNAAGNFAGGYGGSTAGNFAGGYSGSAAGKGAGHVAAVTATKTAAGVGTKKIVAGVVIAALVAGGSGFGIYQGLHSSDEKEPVKVTKEKEETSTAEERALKAYKDYLDQKKTTIKSFRILDLGDRLPTLLCSEERAGNPVNFVSIIQYDDGRRRLESPGSLKGQSANGEIFYKNRRLYTVGYLNGQDFSEYEMRNGEISARGFYREPGSYGRAMRITYRGPLRGVGSAESEIRNMGILEEDYDDLVDRIENDYNNSVLILDVNDQTNRDRIIRD